jgi:hypothetical protein
MRHHQANSPLHGCLLPIVSRQSFTAVTQAVQIDDGSAMHNVGHQAVLNTVATSAANDDIVPAYKWIMGRAMARTARLRVSLTKSKILVVIICVRVDRHRNAPLKKGNGHPFKVPAKNRRDRALNGYCG